MDSVDAREFMRSLQCAAHDAVTDEWPYTRIQVQSGINVISSINPLTLVTLLEGQGWNIEPSKKSQKERETTNG